MNERAEKKKARQMAIVIKPKPKRFDPTATVKEKQRKFASKQQARLMTN